MGEISWAQYQTDRFFEGRKSPSQTQCDEIARSVSGAAAVSPVESPGSMSYTVICKRPHEDLVVSFREQEARLEDGMVQLARQIYGDLVPESTCYGQVQGADPPLIIYSMPYLRGSACVEALCYEVDMAPVDEARHIVFMRDLARYFARSWTQAHLVWVDSEAQENPKEAIRRRLARLTDSASPSTLPVSTLRKLTEILPALFDEDYPQVLTHCDFSVTNILVDEATLAVTGVVDWSLAAVRPFGMDLDILYLTTGFMTRDDGWHDYACKKKLLDAFWEEFWSASAIDGKDRRARVKDLAEAAGQIGAILRQAFRRNNDGSPSEELSLGGSGLAQLRAWLGEDC